MYPSHRQYTTTLSQKLQVWLRRQSRCLPEPWHEATLVLLRLDLDPARPLLRALYAPGPRGRPSKRPRSAPSTPLSTASKMVPMPRRVPTTSAPAAYARAAIGVTSSRNKPTGRALLAA